MSQSSPEQHADDADAGDLPEEYQVSRGERPERIRRRNRITGIVLLLVIATIIGITIYSRTTSEDASYGVDEEARPPFGSEHEKPKPGAPNKK